MRIGVKMKDMCVISLVFLARYLLGVKTFESKLQRNIMF